MARQKVILIDDRHVRKYLRQLDRDSKRKTIYAAASAKAAIPIRRSARQNIKPSLKASAGQSLAKFQNRVNILNSGRKNKIPDRKKKTINLIRVRRGKRKYRGSAWIVGGLLANILENSKGGTRKPKKGQVFPIALASGKVLFRRVERAKKIKRNKFLSRAFATNKSTTIRIFKHELGKAVAKHAYKNRQIATRSATMLRMRPR